MKRHMMDGDEASTRRGRRGAYRRRSSRPAPLREQRAAIMEIGPLDRLARQTALMILAGGAVGVTGRDVFHAASAASLASTRPGRETTVAAQMIRAEFDLLALPGVAAVYRRVGRDAWRQYHQMGEQAEARVLRAALEGLVPPPTMH